MVTFLRPLDGSAFLPPDCARLPFSAACPWKLSQRRQVKSKLSDRCASPPPVTSFTRSRFYIKFLHICIPKPLHWFKKCLSTYVGSGSWLFHVFCSLSWGWHVKLVAPFPIIPDNFHSTVDTWVFYRNSVEAFLSCVAFVLHSGSWSRNREGIFLMNLLKEFKRQMRQTIWLKT